METSVEDSARAEARAQNLAELTTEIEILPVASEEALEVVRSLPPTLGQQPPALFHSYDALGHEVFVPHLEARVARVAPRRDERALYGLNACPCAAATEALIRLCDTVEGDALKKLLQELLLGRIPRHAKPRTPHGEWSTHQAWREDLVQPMQQLARKVLGSASGPRWDQDLIWAASVLGRIGGPEDVLAVLEGIALALEAPLGNVAADRRWRATQALAGALRRIESRAGDLDLDVTALLELLGWDRRTFVPEEHEARVLAALNSPHPTLRAIAAQRLPPEVSPPLVDAVVSLVGTGLPTERFLFVWLEEVAGSQLQGALIDELERAEAELFTLEGDFTGDRVVPLLWALKGQLSLDAWLERVLEHLGPDRLSGERARLLLEGLDLSGCAPDVGMRIAPETIPALSKAWRRTLRKRRRELQRGPLPLEGSDPALFPTGYQCTLQSGGSWP